MAGNHSWDRPFEQGLTGVLVAVFAGCSGPFVALGCASSESGVAASDAGGGTTQTGGMANGGGMATSAGGAQHRENGGSAGHAPGNGGSSGNATSNGTGGAAGARATGGAGGAPPKSDADAGTAPELGTSVTVHLVPTDGVSGSQRVNFAIPLQPGQLDDAARVRVLVGGKELEAGHRALAVHPDGSIRSVQVQFDLDVSGESDIEVRLGEMPTVASLPLVSVDTTLVTPDGEKGPRIWALLPAKWLSGSGFAGKLVPTSEDGSGPGAAWSKLCDYDRYGTDAFLASGYETDRAVWLFDRGTALYRGYARRGEIGPLRSAYVETAMYRNRITGTGTSARNGCPGGGGDDVKYAYSQNLALHYLLTGDERYRESAEDIALGMSTLWSDPGYAGGSDFWTERHAGFGLLAYVWAMIVSDDKKADFEKLADAAVDAYLSMQAKYPPGYMDADARCFAHTADAHGESGAYFGCSPWMSAILGDGLEQYATESDATRAEKVRSSLVQLGRIIARRGIQPDGRPYYFMGVGTMENMTDDYDEHYGESAYLIAMSWFYSGKTDVELRSAADALTAHLGTDGSAPHIRSFNWQCRSAVAGSWFLR